MTNTNEKIKKPSGKVQQRLPFFFGLFLCLFQVFISFPIALWSRNKFNLEAPLTYSYSVLGITFFAIILLSILTTLLIPKKIRSYLAPLLVVFAAVIFIQQNFLAWNYGILDGQSLDFEQNSSLGFLDIAVWGVAICLFIFASKSIKQQATNILLAVGAVTVIMTGMNIATYGPVKTPYAIDESAKFEFSRNENVIVFLFDAYQADILIELAETRPDLVAPLEGFTNYENNVAVFAKTYPTVPLFLTGNRYKKEQPLLDFFKVAYSGSLMEKMQDKGWDVGLYPNVSYFPSLINSIDIRPGIMDNAVGGVPSNAKIDTYLQSLDLSIFRAVPHHFKSKVFNGGKFIVKRERVKGIYTKAIGETNVPQPFTYGPKHRHPAVSFRNLLNEHGALSTDSPVFRFYHFMLPHAPNRLDGDLNNVKHENTFEAYREYSIASLKLMGSYLDSLKKINAYDNATILIVSDHGMGISNKFQYDPEAKDYKKIETFGNRRAAAKSILLVKEPNKRGPLVSSSKPVSGIDVAPTLAAAARIKIDNPEGKRVQSVMDNEARTRLFNFYTFSTWDSRYLDDFETFEIKGDVREDASWTRVGITTEKTKVENKSEYKIGEVLSFGEDIKNDTDFLNAFIDLDQYTKKPNYIEASAGVLDVTIKLDSPARANKALLLQFEIYSGSATDRRIIVNGFENTTFIPPKQRELNRGFFITPEMHKNSRNFDLSFRPTDPQTAKALRLSSVKLSALNPKKITTDLNLLKDFEALLPIGFVKTKTSYDLPIDRVGAFIFDANPDVCRENVLQVTLKGIPPSNPVVTLNDTTLSLLSSKGEDGRTFSYNCSNTELTKNNVVNISIPNSLSEEVIDTKPTTVNFQEISFKVKPA